MPDQRHERMRRSAQRERAAFRQVCGDTEATILVDDIERIEDSPLRVSSSAVAGPV
jgi:hypothetical protein